MSIEQEVHAVLRSTLGHALDHLDRLDASPVAARATIDELRSRLHRPLTDEGIDAGQVIEELVRDVEGGILGSTGGRFFAWVIGGSVPAALGADLLTTAWDQNAGLYACSPAAAVTEEACGAWLKELLGLPATASFALVTGCQMAHTTCLSAARHALFKRRGWDVEKKGLNGGPRLRILSSQRHGSFERSVRLLGLGSDSIVDLVDRDDEVLQPARLKAALDQYSEDAIVVLLQAGEINTGMFDPFEEVIPIARAHGAWVHVDGAFGLWAGASPRYNHLLNGVGAAHSWATDGHKWLNVPFDSGFAFVAEPEPHRNSMSHRASYLIHSSDARDQMDWNPEWSRRARGFPTYAAIRQLGRKGIAEIIERNCAQARELVDRIGSLPGAEIVWEPIINQGLVRFLHSSGIGAEHDRRTDAVISAVLRSGEAFLGGTNWNGMRCMRVSVCNWRTTSSDIDRTVAAFESALRSTAAETRS